MKFTMDKLDGLARKLKVEVPAEKVQSAFENALKSIQKEATVKGFRKGKAPLATIRSIYGDRVKSDVLNDLINEGYQKALDEHSLDPVGYPKIHFDNFSLDESFSFSAEFEVRPEVKLKKYEGLQVEREALNIGNERIDAILNNIRENHAEFNPIFEDRGLALGDIAEISFEGLVDGQPLTGATAEQHMLEMGSKRFIEGFEDGLIGLKPGQNRELNLKFPDDYHSEQIRGKPVLFKVSLKNIKRKVLPEMSDELAQKSGPFKTLQELKDAITADIKESETKRINDDLRNNILKELVKNNPVDVPKSLLEQQMQVLTEDVKKRMDQQGLSAADFETYKSKWGADFEETASFMVQSTFLVDAIATQLNLRATPKEVEHKVDSYSQQTGIEIEKIREFYSKPERRSRLAFQITEEKVVDFLISKASVKEVQAKKD